jgi:hypothetical protein
VDDHRHAGQAIADVAAGAAAFEEFRMVGHDAATIVRWCEGTTERRRDQPVQDSFVDRGNDPHYGLMPLVDSRVWVLRSAVGRNKHLTTSILSNPCSE